MARSGKIVGQDKVLMALKRMGENARKNCRSRYQVVFEAPYAIWVHERTDLRHQAGKQAKFLETAARQELPVMAGIVAKTVKSGGSVDMGNSLAAQHLKRAAQRLCPVSGWDPIISPLLPTSGTLHNSARVVKERR